MKNIAKYCAARKVQSLDKNDTRSLGPIDFTIKYDYIHLYQ